MDLEGRHTLGDPSCDGRDKVSYSGRVITRDGGINGGQYEGEWLIGG